MKKLLLALLLSSFVFAANAQFSVGARTGASYWWNITVEHSDSYFDDIDNSKGLSWDKQLFIRYESKKRFAYELHVTHTALSNKVAPPYEIKYIEHPLPAGTSKQLLLTNNNVWDFTLSLQYKLNEIANKEFKHYIGFAVTHSYITYSDRKRDKKVYTGYITQQTFEDISTLSFGFQYYAQYTFTEHFNVNSLVHLSGNPLMLFAPENVYYSLYPPNTRFSWQLGVGYQL